MAHIRKRLSEDPRMLALIVVGSIAAGTADALSDLDLLIMVRDDAFREVWTGRKRLVASMVRAVYTSDQTEVVRRIGTHRVLTEDGLVIEFAFFTPRSRFRLARPYRVLFDRADAIGAMVRTPRPRRQDMRPLPGGPGDLPFAVDDIRKQWVRGQRARARAGLKRLAEELDRG